MHLPALACDLVVERGVEVGAGGEHCQRDVCSLIREDGVYIPAPVLKGGEILIIRYNLSQDASDVNIVHMDRCGGRNLQKFMLLLTFILTSTPAAEESL